VSTVPTPTTPLISVIFDNERSRSCFDFFRCVSAHEFSRFFDEDFWSGTLLRASHESPAVRHALLAVASLHRSSKYSLRSRTQAVFAKSDADRYASEQYGKALRHLIKDISRSNEDHVQEIALLCAVLFMIVEVLRENDGQALYLLEGAIVLLKQRLSAALSENQPGRFALGTEEELVTLFTRFDLEASSYSGNRLPTLSGGFSASLLPDYDRAGHIAGMAEASHFLNALIGQYLHFQHSFADKYRYQHIGDIPLEIFHQRECLLDEFDRWEDSFSRYLTQERRSFISGSKQEAQENLLRVHHKATVTMLCGCLHVEETVYDSLHAEFQEIVTLSTALNAESSQRMSGKSITLENGIVFPLYWTAMKCRDGQTRRQALAQLQISHQEGVWVPELLSRVAERIIAIEESPALAPPNSGVKTDAKSAEEIAEFNRIHCAVLTFDKRNRAVMATYWRRLNGPDGEWDTATELLSYWL
jgi:hypothetical protein